MLTPAVAGFGVPVTVTARSQATVTGVATVVLLFAEVGSVVVAVTEEFAVIVPAARLDAVSTTTRIFAVAPDASVGFVQVTDVVTVQVQPTGADTEEKVVLVGMASVKLTPDDVPGPLFVMVCV
jgi:hypothetical protein